MRPRLQWPEDIVYVADGADHGGGATSGDVSAVIQRLVEFVFIKHAKADGVCWAAR